MSEKFYHTKESVEQYVEMAREVSGKDLIDELNKHIQKGSEILEIGSGPGTDWKLLNEHHSVIGSDYSEEFLNHLQQSIPEGTFIQIDASNIETSQEFDAIYSNKVLHHLSDEELRRSIEQQASILRPAGVVCHSFWKGEGDEVFKGMFVNYHTQVELEELFSTNFEVLVMKDYMEFEENDSILMIARKS